MFFITPLFSQEIRELTIKELKPDMLFLKENMYYQIEGSDTLHSGSMCAGGNYFVWFKAEKGWLNERTKEISIEGTIIEYYSSKYIPLAKVSRANVINNGGNLLLSNVLAYADSLGHICIKTKITNNQDKVFIYTNNYRIPVPLCYNIGKFFR